MPDETLEIGTPRFVAIPPEYHQSPRVGTHASYPPRAWFCTPSLNLALLNRRWLQLAAKTQQQQSQYHCQHQGKGNFLKITNYLWVWGEKNLSLSYFGFSGQTFAQGEVLTTVLVVQ